jgi:NAD(P)-dependent dehydrogenase (short-subunit alcohol dehydrogenase family)
VAIASALAKEGARIIVNSRTPERVKEAMEQKNREMRKRCWALLSTRLINQTKYVHSSDCSN